MKYKVHGKAVYSWRTVVEASDAKDAASKAYNKVVGADAELYEIVESPEVYAVEEAPEPPAVPLPLVSTQEAEAAPRNNEPYTITFERDEERSRDEASNQ